MVLQRAIDVFQKYGVDVCEMSPGQIRLARNNLLKLYHPDVGGGIEEAREIISSFDLLRNMSPPLLKKMRQSRQPVQAPAQSQATKWAWAGHVAAKVPNTSISRSDFTDRNFFWEIYVGIITLFK